VIFRNNRTPSSEYIGYGLYFYFSGLSLRKTAVIVDYQIALSKEICIFGIGFKSNPQKISSSIRKRESPSILVYKKMRQL